MSKLPKLNLKDIISQPEPIEPLAPEPEASAPVEPAAQPAPQAPARVVALDTGRAASRTLKAPKAREAGKGRLVDRTKQVAVYLEPPVHDQLRELAFHERGSIHGLILEGLDLLLKKRGLKSIAQLTRDIQS